MTILRCVTGFALLASLTSCSSSSSSPANSPPVVDSVDGPTGPVTAQPNGYLIPITIKFHDADNDAITKVRYRIPAGKLDQTSDIPNASPQAVGADLVLLVGASAPKQTYDYTISVFDARGAESNAITKSVTLQ